ncbi:MAG: amidohydrolase [Hyphomonadaceae bacterium]
MRIAHFVATLAVLGLAACQAKPAPDLILYGGVIHTGVDGAQPVEAVAIRSGRIMSVGEASQLVKTGGAQTRLVDLNGAHVYPGFVDSHVHLRGVGERELTLNLDSVGSIAELAQTVAEAADKLSPGAVLIGRGWIETHWPEGRFPTRQDVDLATGDHPALLTRADGHALLANTAALEAMGLLDPVPPDPDGGHIELDAEGVPTGLLVDNAMSLVASLEGASPPEEVERAYVTGARRYASLGWTGVHNMAVAPADIETINRLSDAGDLPLRIYNAVDGDSPDAFNVMGGSKAGLVTTRAIKLFMDGALGSRGALLSAPYADRPDTAGLQRARESETRRLLARAYDSRVQVCFHAIGDSANHIVLDWMEATFAAVPEAEQKRRDPRWRIEHAQILSPTDIPRFASLGVIASMQPSHAIGDLYFAPARLGDARLDGAYAWRSLIDQGAIIAGGSDAPVEKGDPRIEFYAAVARKDLQGRSGPDWRPQEAVTREQALKMFTVWPAYASFREADLGTIEPGKLADLTGFSGDLLTVPEAEILTLEPAITVVAGAVVYDRNAPPF